MCVCTWLKYMCILNKEMGHSVCPFITVSVCSNLEVCSSSRFLGLLRFLWFLQYSLLEVISSASSSVQIIFFHCIMITSGQFSWSVLDWNFVFF